MEKTFFMNANYKVYSSIEKIISFLITGNYTNEINLRKISKKVRLPTSKMPLMGNWSMSEAISS